MLQSEPFFQQSLLMCHITHSVTWLILLWALETFNLQRCQIRMKGKIGLNQYVVYKLPSPHSHPTFYICPSSTK